MLKLLSASNAEGPHPPGPNASGCNEAPDGYCCNNQAEYCVSQIVNSRLRGCLEWPSISCYSQRGRGPLSINSRANYGYCVDAWLHVLAHLHGQGGLECWGGGGGVKFARGAVRQAGYLEVNKVAVT